MWQWLTNDSENGCGVEEALRLRVPAAPQGFVHQLVRKGRVTVDGATADCGQRLAAGMRVSVAGSVRLAELIAASGLPPAALLYEDSRALVVDKPAGLAAHRHPGQADSLGERLAQFVRLRRAPYRVAPVHRLDLGTSGPMLFAKGREAAAHFGRLMREHHFEKRYLALVSGDPPAAGELCNAVEEGGRLRPSLARYRCLARTAHAALLELELCSGRRHQLRQQLAAQGWPIVGDRRYGGETWALPRLFLHCLSLGWSDPDTGRRHRVEVPIPAELQEILVTRGLCPTAARP